MIAHYMLEGKTPILCDDIDVWAEWFFSADGLRDGRVAFTELTGYRIVTSFIGLDHASRFDGHPLLFRTAIYNEDSEEIGERYYHTWDEAELGHNEAVEDLRNV